MINKCVTVTHIILFAHLPGQQDYSNEIKQDKVSEKDAMSCCRLDVREAGVFVLKSLTM